MPHAVFALLSPPGNGHTCVSIHCMWAQWVINSCWMKSKSEFHLWVVKNWAVVNGRRGGTDSHKHYCFCTNSRCTEGVLVWVLTKKNQEANKEMSCHVVKPHPRTFNIFERFSPQKCNSLIYWIKPINRYAISGISQIKKIILDFWHFPPPVRHLIFIDFLSLHFLSICQCIKLTQIP